MFNRKDPLIGAVSKIMEENEHLRQIEQKLCEELGIVSRKQLPNEHQANYDALLEQKIAEALHPNQQKLDVHEPEKDKLTAQDFKMLRAMGKKKPTTEETITQDAKNPIPKTAAERIKGDAETAPKFVNKPADQSKLTDADKSSMTDKVKEIMKEYAELDESVSATSYNDADGNKTWDVTHKKKKIGSITVNKKGSWSYEHEPSGNYEDGYDSKREAVKELKDTHKYHEKIMKDGTLEEETEKKKAMLHSYVKKAIEKQKSGEEPEEKRAKGLRKATTRLYKEEESLDEKAPPGAKFERMVKHIKKKYSKDGLTDKEKSIAYATAWKAKNKEEMKEAVMAELKKNLGDKKMKEIEEERDSDVPETNAKPAPKAAEKPLADLSGGVDIAGGGMTGGAKAAPEPNVNIAAASKAFDDIGGGGAQEKASNAQPADTKASASDRAQFQAKAAQGADTQASAADRAAFKARTGQGGTPAATSNRAAEMGSDSRSQAKPTDMAAAKAAERGAPTPAAAPKPAPRPAARPAAAPAPAAKPAAQEPVNGPDDQTSPLAALRQYAASKAAGNFGPTASSARPATRPATRPAGRLRESLEDTIRKNLLKEQNDENN